jgi:hypothetical protein
MSWLTHSQKRHMLAHGSRIALGLVDYKATRVYWVLMNSVCELSFEEVEGCFVSLNEIIQDDEDW